MIKRDKVVKWFDDEIKRIRLSAYRHADINYGKPVRGLDDASKRQIEQLQLQRQQYIETGQG